MENSLSSDRGNPVQSNTAGSQFVTFRIDEEIYAIDVFKSREIIGVPRITRVPGMPDAVRGVVNVRGDVIPVLDLKMKFGGGATEFKLDTAIIITEIRNGEDTVPAGMVVDAVREVLSFDDSELEPPPRLGAGIRNNYIMGMGRAGGGFITVLDIDRIFSDEDMSYPV